MKAICFVVHPELGRGRVEQVTTDADGELLCFVRWIGRSTGVAGGWYDLADERFTIEGAAKLAAAARPVLEKHAAAVRRCDELGIRR
jgi:hypothetical protein